MWASQAKTNHPDDEGDKAGQQKIAFGAVEDQVCGQDQAGNHDQHEQGVFALERFRFDSQGVYDGRHAKDQSDVGDIGTDGITDGQPWIAAIRGHARDNQFRRRSTESHDGQADDERGHSEVSRKRGCTGDEAVSTPDEQDESAGQLRDGNQHVTQIAFSIGSGSIMMSGVRNGTGKDIRR